MVVIHHLFNTLLYTYQDKSMVGVLTPSSLQVDSNRVGNVSVNWISTFCVSMDT